MTPDQRAAHARALLDDALMIDILARAEKNASDLLINTNSTDHLALMAAQANVRAVQDLKRELLKCLEPVNPTKRAGIA